MPSRDPHLDPPAPAPTSSVPTITDRAAALVVKVFSATRPNEREALGDRVASWLRDNPQLEVRRTVVSQSSDAKFHCLSLVLICTDVRRAG